MIFPFKFHSLNVITKIPEISDSMNWKLVQRRLSGSIIFMWLLAFTRISY
jgi:hypothetical protein